MCNIQVQKSEEVPELRRMRRKLWILYKDPGHVHQERHRQQHLNVLIWEHTFLNILSNEMSNSLGYFMSPTALTLLSIGIPLLFIELRWVNWRVCFVSQTVLWFKDSEFLEFSDHWRAFSGRTWQTPDCGFLRVWAAALANQLSAQLASARRVPLAKMQLQTSWAERLVTSQCNYRRRTKADTCGHFQWSPRITTTTALCHNTREFT